MVLYIQLPRYGEKLKHRLLLYLLIIIFIMVKLKKNCLRVNPVKHDQPLLAVLLTLSGWPVGEIFTQVMKHYGLTTLSALDSISLMWVKEPSWALGALGAIGFNFWIAMVIYIVPKYGEPIICR